MTFRENLNRICTERGTKLTPMLKKLQFSSSKATAINKGQIPKEEDLHKIAEFLGCQVADFFAEDPAPPIDIFGRDEPRDEDEAEIVRIFRTLSRRERHEFMSTVYEFEKRSIKTGIDSGVS